MTIYWQYHYLISSYSILKKSDRNVRIIAFGNQHMYSVCFKKKVYFIRKKRTYFIHSQGVIFIDLKKHFPKKKCAKFEIQIFCTHIFYFFDEKIKTVIGFLINCLLKSLDKMTFKHPAKRSGFLYIRYLDIKSNSCDWDQYKICH